MASAPLAEASAQRQRAISTVWRALGALSNPPQDLEGMRDRIDAGGDARLVEDLGLDSLGAMEFCIQLELEHGLLLSPEELLSLRSLRQLLPLIEARGLRPSSDGAEAAAAPG